MCHYKDIIDVLENNHKKLNDAAKEMQRISRGGHKNIWNLLKEQELIQCNRRNLEIERYST